MQKEVLSNFYSLCLIVVVVAIPAALQPQDFTIDITPGDTTVEIGAQVQYAAALLDSNNTSVDTTFAWSISGDPVGSITQTGLFTASSQGKAYVVAGVGELADSVRIEVEEGQSASVEIITDEIELVVGDSVQLLAVYIDPSGEEIDTSFTWSVVPDSLGNFNDIGLFTATHVGEGHVFAQLGELVDSTGVRVEAEEAGEGEGGEGPLVISPGDTVVDVGSTVQFSAFYQDTTGALIDTVPQWFIYGDPIGTISSDGLLTVVSPGVGLVKGKLDNWERTSTVTAVDTTADPTGVNVINISRVLPSGRVLPPQTLNEGEVYVIGGLPYPLNLLNDGWLYFPTGSLHEDITIHIKLPEFANVGKDTVTFGGGIITGADFDVFVSDSLLESYYFDIPLNVAIPFKRGLINSLGIDPADLGLFFALDSTTFDTAGIYNVTVDSVANRIFSQVAHFSTLVVAEKTIAVSVQDGPTAIMPKGFRLMQNYPNPFNPVTTIEFSMPRSGQVTLTVYDMLGREVDTLLHKQMDAGGHTLQWNARNVASGIYLVRMVSGDFTQTRKLLLLR